MFGAPYREPANVGSVLAVPIPDDAHRTAFEEVDIVVNVAYAYGSVIHNIEVNFTSDKCEWPFDTYVKVSVKSHNPSSLKNGFDKYGQWLNSSALHGFARLNATTVVPWHRVVCCTVTQQKNNRKGTIAWKWEV
jgi:hypothetical protein